MARQSFVVYKLIVQAAGAIAKQVPLLNFTHDLDSIVKAMSPKTRVVFLANPNNPTGTIYRREQWERFLDQLSPDVLVIADEAYFEYVGVPDYPDSLKYHGSGRTLLTLRTFSKLYGLAGLRIGYGIGPKEIIGLMQRVRQPFNINAVAQWGALAALDDREHKQRTLAVNHQGMEYLTKELKRLRIEFVPSHANFIFLRVGNGEAVFKRLLAQGIIVRTMEVYEFPEHLRVTVGTMEQNRRFIEGLEKTINAL